MAKSFMFQVIGKKTLPCFDKHIGKTFSVGRAKQLAKCLFAEMNKGVEKEDINELIDAYASEHWED